MKLIIRTGVRPGEVVPDTCWLCKPFGFDWDHGSRKDPTYTVRLICEADDTSAERRTHE